MYFVYLLKSLLDSKYYIGHAENVEIRVKRHNDGFVPATKHRRPLQLIGYELFESQQQARFREYQLKHNTNERKKFYRKFDKLPL